MFDGKGVAGKASPPVSSLDTAEGNKTGNNEENSTTASDSYANYRSHGETTLSICDGPRYRVARRNFWRRATLYVGSP